MADEMITSCTRQLVLTFLRH